MTTRPRHRFCYAAVLTAGGHWAIGLVEEDRLGYSPKPQYGEYPDFAAAERAAADLNWFMFPTLTREDSAAIVASSMRAQNQHNAGGTKG
jgi:hypothetical protein